jgi:hypothetical protein
MSRAVARRPVGRSVAVAACALLAATATTAGAGPARLGAAPVAATYENATNYQINAAHTGLAVRRCPTA